MYKFEFGGFSGEIDVNDLDTQLLIEKASDEHKIKTDELAGKISDIRASEFIRGFCHSVFEYFNTIFGEGTAKKMFGDRTNMDICQDATVAFSAFLIEERKNAVKKYNAATKTLKTAATGNRSQRRAKK